MEGTARWVEANEEEEEEEDDAGESERETEKTQGGKNERKSRRFRISLVADLLGQPGDDKK